MSEGRLIRVTKHHGKPQAIAYLVAVPDKAQALKIIRDRVAMPEDEIEDLGRVSENLLVVFSLAPSAFCSVSGVQHVGQQQQQSQPKAALKEK